MHPYTEAQRNSSCPAANLLGLLSGWRLTSGRANIGWVMLRTSCSMVKTHLAPVKINDVLEAVLPPTALLEHEPALVKLGVWAREIGDIDLYVMAVILG